MYPDLIGEDAFIGIKTSTREIFAMSGLKDRKEERKFVGWISKDALANAENILHDQKNIQNEFTVEETPEAEISSQK